VRVINGAMANDKVQNPEEVGWVFKHLDFNLGNVGK